MNLYFLEIPKESWDSASLDKWLMDYKGGKFKKLGGQGVDGNDLLGLSEAQLCKILSNILGSVLYNLLHPKPAPTARDLQKSRKGKRKIAPKGKGPVSKKRKLQHFDSEIVTIRPDGVDVTGKTTYLTPREETVKNLYRELKQKQVILIRSPPYSGKTSLSQLLANHIKLKVGEENVIRLSLLRFIPGTMTFSEYWLQRTTLQLDENFLKKRDQRFYIILDEVQILYPHENDLLWRILKDIQSEPKEYHIYVILFAAYGYGAIGGGTGTPLSFAHTGGLDMILGSKSEVAELISDFNTRNSRKLQISDELRDHLYKITLGHFGFICYTLSFLLTTTQPVGTDGAKYTLLMSEYYLNQLSQMRGVPQFARMPNEQQKFCRDILYHGPIALSQASMHEYLEMIKNGTIVPVTESGKYEFSSPIIGYLATVTLLAPSIRPEKDLVHNLDDFIVMCLSNIRQSFLQNTLGTGLSYLLLERSWQMEFFSAAHMCFGRTTFISPDVGHIFGTTGLVDFYVNGDKQWAIELLREGADLGEHLDRFNFGGLYQKLPWKAMAVIDFRSATGAQPRKQHDYLWSVLYSDDFTHAIIKRKGKQDQRVNFRAEVIVDPKQIKSSH